MDKATVITIIKHLECPIILKMELCLKNNKKNRLGFQKVFKVMKFKGQYNLNYHSTLSIIIKHTINKANQKIIRITKMQIIFLLNNHRIKKYKNLKHKIFKNRNNQ